MEFFYIYDGDGNIGRSIDLTSKKEYNYEYEEGRIVRATEADIELSGEIVTSKVIVNTVKYYYDTDQEGDHSRKRICSDHLLRDLEFGLRKLAYQQSFQIS